MLRRYCLTLIVFVAAYAQAGAQWVLMKSDADSLVQVGIRQIYNMEFDSAATSFVKVQELYPQHPVGYFLSTMVDWWKIQSDSRTRKYDEGFLRKVDSVILICNARIEENPEDIVGLFFKGGVLGYRGRFYVKRKDWVRAAGDGKEALDIVMKCWDIAPGNKDIMLGVGIYHYFAEALPEKYPIIKPLMLFLPDGSKEMGLQELELAAELARYAAVEAKVVLLQIYYRFESDFKKCAELADGLLAEYPQNPLFHRYLARSYVKLGYIDKYEAAWREILKRCIAQRPGYDYYTAREGMYYIGVASMARKRYDLALKYFYKCDEFSRGLDKDGESGFMVLLNLRIGYIYDLQGKRDLAEEQYEKVLDFDEYRGSHSLAEKYLEKPYGKR